MHLYYKKIDVIGADTVPDTGSVIFCPNHQNALMDALAVICAKDRQPVFVARADIFHQQKGFIVDTLHSFRILPIYRKRDGGVSSDNNQETFDLITKVLHSELAVGIMPEGTHNKYKRLQSLQKGVFRLAMQVQEKFGATPMVKIIPVGLEYTNYYKFRSDLMVRFGEAIELSDFYDLYVENQAKAFKKMQDVLSEKMTAGMINIVNEQYYTEIDILRVLYQRRMAQRAGLDIRNAEQRLLSQQTIVFALQELAQTNPDEMSALCLAVRNYFAILEKHNLRDWVIERQPYCPANLLGRSALALPGVPFWILGMLFNYIPYKLSAFASRKVQDPQFISSVQFVASLVAFPVYYLIMTLLIIFLIPCIWGKLTMLAIAIPAGLFSFRYYISIKKLCARFRFWLGKCRKSPDLLEAIDLRKGIFEKMDVRLP